MEKLRTPFLITKSLVILFWLTFFLSLFLSQALSPNINTLFQLGGFAPQIPETQGESYRFIAHMFLHGSFLHILMNSIALYFVGRFIEVFWGHAWMLGIFLISGMSGASIAGQFSDAHTLLIGASGGVMGTLGCLVYTGTFILHKSPFRKEVLRSSYQIIIPSLIPLISGVSYSAHLGGALTGFCLGALLHIFTMLPAKIFRLISWVAFAASTACILYTLVLMVQNAST